MDKFVSTFHKPYLWLNPTHIQRDSREIISCTAPTLLSSFMIDQYGQRAYNRTRMRNTFLNRTNEGVVREGESGKYLDCVLFTKSTHHVFQMAEQLKTMLVFQSQLCNW